MMGKVGCLINMVSLLLGFLMGSVTKVDIDGSEKKKCNFRFWIASDAWSVSLFFWSLYIAAIL